MFSDSLTITSTGLKTDFNFPQVHTSSQQLSKLAAPVTWDCSFCPSLFFPASRLLISLGIRTRSLARGPAPVDTQLEWPWDGLSINTAPPETSFWGKWTNMGWKPGTGHCLRTITCSVALFVPWGWLGRGVHASSRTTQRPTFYQHSTAK